MILYMFWSSKCMVNSSKGRVIKQSTRQTILGCDELTIHRIDWHPYHYHITLEIDNYSKKCSIASSEWYLGLKFCHTMNICDSSVFGLLEERCNRADLTEMFKMLRGKACPNFDSMFERSRNLSTRGHSVELMKHHCTTDLKKHFFSEQVIDRWNMLTEDCVSSNTINKFKGKLTKIRNNKMAFYGSLMIRQALWLHQA